jgi:hypothetical protein
MSKPVFPRESLGIPEHQKFQKIQKNQKNQNFIFFDFFDVQESLGIPEEKQV